MRNGLGGAAPENAELAFSGGFAATDETDFELIRYIALVEDYVWYQRFPKENRVERTVCTT